MKQKIIFLIFFCACITVQAQKKNHSVQKAEDKPATISYSTTTSGLQYRIIKDSVGGNFPEVGGFISFWFEIRTQNDSIITTLFGDPHPAAVPVTKVRHEADIEEGLMLLTAGDSAEFLLDADSLYINSFGTQKPDFLNGTSHVKMIIKMDNVYTRHFVDSLKSDQQARVNEKLSKEVEIFKRDSLLIQRYLIKHQLKGEATSGGAYVVKLKNNDAAKARFINIGESIETTYVGTLLINGTEFDRSPEGKYFKFTVGVGEVIRGWDEAFRKLKHGEKALILIPSRLAYGDSSAGTIPPDSPLIFEVEVK
ncbi:MAG: FKBP-type peptidyl-prolyl cis-trans isomerase [Cytophaga sp.]|uniref:FKBP-type peptidyl-prolyl cis-trans isomerase n=1 Tax=Cytophaga sp. TaxID=29535 RepID=UPI003F7FD683